MIKATKPFQPDSKLPQWLQSLKSQSWDYFNTLPLPQRTDELWRFSRFNQFDLENYQYQHSLTPTYPKTLEKHSSLLGTAKAKLIIADDYTIEEPNITEELEASGVIYSSLEKAFEQHSDLIQKYFTGEDTELGSKKFSALHTALNRNGSFLYVPRGVTVKQPLIAAYCACSDGLMLFPHTLIIVEESANVTLTDLFLSSSEQINSLIFAKLHLYAATEATVRYQALQNWNEQSHCFHLNTVSAEKDATIRTVNVNLGAHSMRHEHHSRVIGAGSTIETHSLSLTHNNQEIDQRTLQTHYAPHTKSDLLFKNVLLDDARSIFSGLIQVEEKAQQTDAYQTNRNLLLSDSAEANALPGLEIKANDVKCSHGTTTGHLDDNEIFYFLARGITREVAKALLAFGFFEEILEKLECEDLVNEVRILVQKKLTKKN